MEIEAKPLTQKLTLQQENAGLYYDRENYGHGHEQLQLQKTGSDGSAYT